MFSRNGKISEKQMRRMLVLPLFAGTIFVLPYLSSRLFGDSLLPGMLLFLFFSIIYVTCIYAIGKRKEKSKEGHVHPSTPLLLLQFFRLFIRLTFYILLSSAILQEGQVPFTKPNEGNTPSNLLVLLPLLLVALYGANHSMEKVGRLHEMLFWISFVPFISMLVFGLPEVHVNVFLPHLNRDISTLVFSSFGLLPLVLPVEYYLFLLPHMKDKKTKWRSYGALISVLGIAAILSIFILGIYGIQGAEKESMLTISIMRYIRLPFGVLERFDVLMIWFFMTGCFVLICNSLFYMGYLLRFLIKDIHCKWWLLGFLILSLITAGFLPDYPSSLWGFLLYGVCIDVPLSLLIPLFSKGKKTLRVLAILPLFFLLTGCDKDMITMRNVEERDYATVMVVSKRSQKEEYTFNLGIAQERLPGQSGEQEELVQYSASTLEELQDQYALTRGKELSLVHLKVILLETTEAEDFSHILFQINDNPEIAKTCPLLLLHEREKFITYMSQAKEPVGSYINGLITTTTRQGKKIPRIKDYLRMLREGDPLFVYELQPEKENWQLVCITKY